MNYNRIYNKIVENAIKETRSKGQIYYEKHHILPRSLGGNNSINNLVLLTGREHYICHILLAKIHGGKMWFPQIGREKQSLSTSGCWAVGKMDHVGKLISKALTGKKNQLNFYILTSPLGDSNIFKTLKEYKKYLLTKGLTNKMILNKHTADFIFTKGMISSLGMKPEYKKSQELSIGWRVQKMKRIKI